MLITILRLLGSAAFCVLVTALTWKIGRRGNLRPGGRILVGLVYGAFAVLSSHLAVHEGEMLVSVRNMGPLAAGLFFHPLSGVIAGLIGGIERWLIGEYAGMGVYTQLAGSLSTILSGLLPIPLYYIVFRRKRPTAFHAFSLGAVMEVLQIYLIFLTHSDETQAVYELIQGHVYPMILCTALGLAGCSLAVLILSGEKIHFPGLGHRHEKPLSRQFQFWLLLGTLVMFIVNFSITHLLETRTANEEVRYRLDDWFGDLSASYAVTDERWDQALDYLEREQLKDARVLSRAARALGGANTSSERLEAMRTLAEMKGIYLIGADGQLLAKAGAAFPETSRLEQLESFATLHDVLSGQASETVMRYDFTGILTVTACDTGVYLCCLGDLLSQMTDITFMDFTQFFEGSSLPPEARYQAFWIWEDQQIDPMAGSLGLTGVTGEQAAVLLAHADGEVFSTDLFDRPALCKFAILDPSAHLYLLVLYSEAEAFSNRNATLYMNTFSDILVFVTIYLIVSVLMERMVVRPLSSVNASLKKITGGDLSETVSVRTSAEFDALSMDINTTVDTLKGYIHAAEKRMEQELRLAWEIQASALPKNFTFPDANFDLYALMDPAKEIGGDFYDFFFVDSHRFALVIADVSGKGIPAALFMMRSKAAIRNLSESGNTPADIFAKANHFLCDGNDAEMFVTAWIGILDLETGEMQCANAGHEYPALYRAEGRYALLKDAHSLALATMDDIPMKQYSLQLKPGDRIFVYTDGVPEAINEQEEAYGTDRLIRFLNGHLDLPARDLLPLLRRDVSDFAGAAEQFDDITMLGFTWFGPEEPSA